ncbi:hypothetical protein RRG08_061505 [Elysia crispata]|uniref:Uncharacterized protein n=2 Tax=Elysia crispata TaxID=231223 RepID=A0AAE0XRG1_9GAST|nr:hypothetical protein RRG08_061505 [Elysia crispata]
MNINGSVEYTANFNLMAREEQEADIVYIQAPLFYLVLTLLENQRREDEETWPRPLPDLLDSDEDDYHDDEIVYAYESPVEEDNCEPDSTTDL